MADKKLRGWLKNAPKIKVEVEGRSIEVIDVHGARNSPLTIEGGGRDMANRNADKRRFWQELFELLEASERRRERRRLLAQVVDNKPRVIRREDLEGGGQ